MQEDTLLDQLSETLRTEVARYGNLTVLCRVHGLQPHYATLHKLVTGQRKRGLSDLELLVRLIRGFPAVRDLLLGVEA
jgi:hypothetical protein